MKGRGGRETRSGSRAAGPTGPTRQQRAEGACRLPIEGSKAQTLKREAKSRAPARSLPSTVRGGGYSAPRARRYQTAAPRDIYGRRYAGGRRADARWWPARRALPRPRGAPGGGRPTQGPRWPPGHLAPSARAPAGRRPRSAAAAGYAPRPPGPANPPPPPPTPRAPISHWHPPHDRHRGRGRRRAGGGRGRAGPEVCQGAGNGTP